MVAFNTLLAGAVIRRSRAVSFAALALVLAAPAFADPVVRKTEKVGVGLYQSFIDNNGALNVSHTGAQRAAPDGKILVLDPETLAVKSEIVTRDSAALGLAFNARTNTVFTTDTRHSNASVVDLAEGKIVATFTHGEKAHPYNVVVDEAANRAYISVTGGPEDEKSAVWVVDGETRKINRVIENLGGRAAGIALDAANNQLFLTRLVTHDIAVVDLAKNAIARTFKTGGEGPIRAVLDAKGNRLFVANQVSGTLTVLNPQTGELVKSVETGKGAIALAYNPANDQIYVGNRGTGTVTIVSGKDYAVIADLKTGSHPNHITVDPKTNLVYVVNKAKRADRGQPEIVDPEGDTVSIIAP
ncbi:MAG: YncE family protein [Pseudochelatococcus sp.]|jgi:YVTN family beta-propeller protein|uniref:YncE family protein n=1 Tax=Pseudochelatococcus sp. TaxID=2020869 RepID=UPI003D938AA8